jgi:hypothetical protein
MGVLATSAQVEKAFSEYAARKSNENAERCLDMFRPFLRTLVSKHPLWVQEDLEQVLSIQLCNLLPELVRKHAEGRIQKLLQYTVGVMDHKAKDYVKKQMRDQSRYCRIDDVDIVVSVHAGKDHEMQEMIKYVRKAIREMIVLRWIDKKEAARASRWAQIMLTGQRPTMDTNCIARFNGTRYEAGKHMYSIVLHRLRELFLAGGHEIGIEQNAETE